MKVFHSSLDSAKLCFYQFLSPTNFKKVSINCFIKAYGRDLKETIKNLLFEGTLCTALTSSVQ